MPIRVTGRVLDSASGDGLSGIIISNGENVVKTSATGHYSITVEAGIHAFISVCTPDTHKAPGHFYSKTPDRDSYLTFILDPAFERARGEFTLAQISDTHVVVEDVHRPLGATLTRESGDILAVDLQRLESEAAPALVLGTGDLTDWGTVAELESFRDAINKVKTPVYPVFGGHDGDEECYGPYLGSGKAYVSAENKTCTRNYEKVLGPVYYSFDWGGRHFVAFAMEDDYFNEEDRRRRDKWLIADLSHRRRAARR